MKKSQVKFGETLAVIIVVYLIILVGSVWYNNINTKDLNKLHEDNQLNLAFEKYHFITNLDFIRISNRGKLDENFDYYSLKTFEDFAKNQGQEFIRKNLGEAYIHLYLYNQSLFKDNDVKSFENFTLYNNSLGQNTQKEVFWGVIPIKNPINRDGTTYFGILRVEIPFNR